LATRLKNKYGPVIALVLLVHLSALALLAAADVIRHREYLDKDYYFRSPSFHQQLTEVVNLAITVHFKEKNDPKLTVTEKVGADTLEQIRETFAADLREKEEEIKGRYEANIMEAERSGNHAEASRLAQARDQELARVKQENQKQMDERIMTLAAARDQEYEQAKKALAVRGDTIKYYIKDRNTGEVYTNHSYDLNIIRNLQKKAAYSIHFPLASPSDYQIQQANEFFLANNLEGYLIIPQAAAGYSRFQDDYAYALGIRERLLNECILLAVSVIAAVGLFVYLRKRSPLDFPLADRCASLLRRVPLDVRGATVLAVGLVTLSWVRDESFFYFPIGLEHVTTLSFTAACIAYLGLNAKEAWRLINDHTLLRQQWESSLYRKFRTLLAESFSNRSVFFKASLIFVLTIGLGTGMGFVLIGLHYGSERLFLVGACYSLLYLAAVLPYILRRVALLNNILRGADEMAAGNLDSLIEERGKGNLAHLARCLNNIKLGLGHALESQMKSERLKTELISNVSHDLKTPLTSIVNYVNLLKRPDLSPEEVSSYVNVLERKTHRLKVLIDDLFEASKMASGSVELHMERVNVAALLNQALAEFSDAIAESSLTFRVQTEKPHIHALADGKKTWRVFENLIGNVLKYALPHTRVYISLTEQANSVVLTMKNVSAYEIEFDPDELFERFKRGDQSRHTEGSGLGLAIAKSIMELQGGRLAIELDGDLFKVIVEFQKA
jgi:signal transduction histidine kinase